VSSVEEQVANAGGEGQSDVTDDIRRRFTRIAEQLIPAGERMPAAGDVDVGGAQLDLVLRTLPDLQPHLVRALSWSEPPQSGIEWVRRLQVNDPDASVALTVAVVGAYYTHPEVRRLLDYPGQLGKPVLIEYPEYVTEGLLDAVLERGPIYRNPEDGGASSARKGGEPKPE
jgi:hypothetical protein